MRGRIALTILLGGAMGCVASALAADLPTTKAYAAPVASSPYSPSGLYVGGFAGGSVGEGPLKDLSNPAFALPALNAAGFAGGGFVGYNLLTPPLGANLTALLLGGEAEIGYDGRRGASNSFYSLGSPRGQSLSGGYAARLRARVGVPLGQALVFTAGGLSLGDAEIKIQNLANGFSQSIGRQLVGFNVGGGLEYAFDARWIGRVEYIYDTYGRHDYDFAVARVFGARQLNLSENTGRVALEYKF